MQKVFIFLTGIISLLLVSCNNDTSVDLLVHNAKIYTVDSSFSTAEAMAIMDGKIIATGSSKDLLEKYKGKEVIDAGGKAIVPGLIDAHCHFTGYATDMWKCHLTGTNSWEEILQKLQEYASTTPTEWIYGRGWDQNDWAVKSYPDKSMLDSLFPDRPVFLKRVDGHAAIVNQKAIDLAGLKADMKFEGGSVDLKDGKITGLLIDNAMHFVDAKIPLLSDSLALQYYKEAQKDCFELGLTGVHDCGISEHTLSLLEQSQKSGDLKMKIYALLSDKPEYYDNWIKKGPFTHDRIHMGGFKVYADGALGSRGASLLEDYSDKPGFKGFLVRKPEHFSSLAKKLADSKLQMCTHAIGDSGNRTILKIYADVLAPGNDRRWRIEHAQVVNENDFHFFKDFNIIPSIQPTHATSDMYWAEERVGKERMQGAYAYNRLLQTNGWLPLGTDFPVEYLSPFKTFYAAVARMDGKGYPTGGFMPENALSREAALRGMTIWAAKAAFEENEKGSLEAGKAADFIILNQDMMQVPFEKLLDTKVMSTYSDGVKVYGN